MYRKVCFEMFNDLKKADSKHPYFEPALLLLLLSSLSPKY